MEGSSCEMSMLEGLWQWKDMSSTVADRSTTGCWVWGSRKYSLSPAHQIWAK